MPTQTRRQREVLDLITRYIEKNGHRPSYQAIALRLGLRSRAGIARIVHDLESQGLLTRRREDGHFYIDVSAAESGVLIEWIENHTEDVKSEPWQNQPLSLPAFMIGEYAPESIRAFRVTDDAMAADGIYEDDIALIELREFARDRQIIGAVINETDTVLRRYHRAGADIELSTGAAGGEVISVAANNVEIIGIYRGLIRPMI